MSNLTPRRKGQSAVTHWRQAAELAAVDHTTDVADAQVEGVNRVTHRAMYETMMTSLLRQKAEQIAPDGAELYAMIAVAGAVQSARVISTMNRRW
ncbi:MAG: hypothetical protein WKF73_18620 [Nocardioidaceae bacterium]|jgi:hypothetical protein